MSWRPGEDLLNVRPTRLDTSFGRGKSWGDLNTLQEGEAGRAML